VPGIRQTDRLCITKDT